MSALFDASHVYLDNPAATRDAALEFVASKAVELGVATDASAVLAALEARESEGSTGMMGGFAVPHCTSSAVSQATVIVVKFADEVDWTTMDKTPVRVAVALLIPDGDAATKHLGILSRIAVMLMHDEFRAKVTGSTSKQEIAAAVEEGLSE